MAEDKLVGKEKLNTLVKALDSRSKTRDSQLQDAIDLRLIQPEEQGIDGQILSVNEDGSTEWIDNSELITTDKIDDVLDEVFKDEVDYEGTYIEVNKIAIITTSQIDDIINSVF